MNTEGVQPSWRWWIPKNWKGKRKTPRRGIGESQMRMKDRDQMPAMKDKSQTLAMIGKGQMLSMKEKAQMLMEEGECQGRKV